MAFAISDDHRQQEKIWNDLPEWSKQDAHAIRDVLTEAHIEADSKLALFVTLAAYEAAGGAVLRDLFDADSAGWITDPALLNRLATKSWNAKRKAFAPKAGNGSRSCRTLHGIRCAHSTAFTHADRAATDEIDELQAQIIDEDGEASDELSDKLEQLESEIASREQTLASIEEACGASAKSGYVTLKKAALADAAEATMKGLRWLPELLRAA